MPQPFVGEHMLSVIARWYLLTGKDDKRALNSLSSSAMQLSMKYVHHPMVDDVLKLYGKGIARHEALTEHTGLPYHAPLTKYPELHSIIQQEKYQGCFSKNRRKIKQTSTPTTRYNSVLKYGDVWRWCHQCVEDDTEKLGMPYWHVAHQLPSTVRCYKHRETALSVKCKCCNFEIRDLRSALLPPIDNDCYACGEQVSPIEFNSSDALNFIENASFDLLNLCGDLKSHRFNYVMQRGLQNYHSRLLHRYKNKAVFALDKEQQRFNAWLLANGLDIFFHQPERALIGKVLDINHGAYQAKNWPPLSVLLWLAYIGEPWPKLDAVV